MHNAQCALHMSLNVFMRLTLTAYVSASAMASATAPAITNATCCICNNIVYTTTPTMHASVSATANVKFNVSFVATYCLTPDSLGPVPVSLGYLLPLLNELEEVLLCSVHNVLFNPLIHLVLFLFLLAIFFLF